jgi:transmembrane sensor
MPNELPEWTDDERAVVARLLAGECDGPETERARALIERAPAIAHAVTLLQDDVPEGSTAEVRESWRRISAAIDSPSLASRPRSIRQRNSSHSPRWIGMTIATVVVAFGVLAYMKGLAPRLDPPPTRYATTTGQQATVTLAGGHRLTLAPQSVALVTGTTVQLQGEAAFDVASATSTPFTVFAGPTSVRVLGTQFSVRRYDGDPATQVVVRSGKVSVVASASRRTITANAGDIVYADSATLSTARDTGADTTLAWTRGSLVFDRTALHDVTTQLSRWYGVTFVVRDSALRHIPLTITFRTSDDVAAIMHAIEVTTGTAVRREGRTITITRPPRPAAIPEVSSPVELARVSARARASKTFH